MKKIVFLDMDGTIYLGNSLIDGTIEFIQYLNHNRIQYIFVTNNSSKSVGTYINKLNKMGIPSDTSNYYTSTQAAIDYLSEIKAKSVYTIGTSDFELEISKHFKIETEEYTDNVLLGFDTELTYKKIERACKLIDSGANFIATNPDMKCPIGSGRYLPDCGAIANLITAATGKLPLYLGKPNPKMILNILSARRLQKEDAIIIGDRLYTDVLTGVNAGVDSIAVLTGETTKAEIKNSIYQPTYTCESIKDVFQLFINGVL